MQKQLSKVDCSRGAPMGRYHKTDLPEDRPVKLYLQKIQLNSGGYDRGGAYWGLRFPQKITRNIAPIGAKGKALHTYTTVMSIYWYYDASGKIDSYVDAENRDHAKEIIKELFPLAKFYR